MALKGALLLFLVALSTIGISRTQSPRAFQRKHITFLDNMDHNKCNSEMRNKRISLTRNGCKPLNTFIHAPEKLVSHACVAGKTYVIKNVEYKRSPRKLRVTTCRLSAEYPNSCSYLAEASSWKYVVISCDQNDQPVHLAGTVNW